MKTIYLALLICCLIIPSHADAHEAHSAKKGVFTKHFNESLFKISEKGLFSVEILMDEKEYKIGKDVIGLIVHDDHDSDVEGATIDIVTSSNQEAVVKPPVVKEKGDGLYIIANLNLQREDSWELRIKIKKKKVEDTAIFIFPTAIMERMASGKYEFGSKK